jgi:hypothetical protein
MKLILTLSLFFAFNTTFAQFLSDAVRPLGRSFGRPLPLTADGKQLAGVNVETSGSPFFTENWCNVNLQLANGDIYNVPQAKLEIMNNHLYYLDSRGEQMFLDAKELKRVEFRVDTVLYSFSVHSEVKAGKELSAFYRVLTEGKITLLNRVKKVVEESRNNFTQEVKREILTRETACIFFNDAITTVKFRESFWEPVMERKWAAVQAHAGKNALDFKSLDNVKQLITYYNTL